MLGEGKGCGETLTVREIEFSIKDSEAGISEVFALITSLTDHERHSAEDIARLYPRRWRAETLIEILKIQIRGTHATFRSKTPAIVRQEMFAPLCAYQAVRQVIDTAVDTPPPPLTTAFLVLVADLPRMLIRRHAPGRTTPWATRRVTNKYPKRQPDTGTTRVAEDQIIVHYLTRRE